MRRLLLPILLMAIAIGATVQMNRANEDADPGRATEVSTEPDLTTPLLSARRAPEWLRYPESDALLTDAISSVLGTAATPATSCVLVERDGEQLAGSNLGISLPTAELHRLITATVVDSVGSGSGFRTEIAIANEAVITVDEEDGTAELEGDIWIIGGGDPGLATQAYSSRFDNGRVFTDFDQLAADAIAWLQERNIVSIRGRIIGDESKYAPNERDYDDERAETGDGDTVRVWDPSSSVDNEVGPLSALLLNDGFVSWPEDVFDQSQNGRAGVPSEAAAAFFDDILELNEISVLRSAQDGVAPPIGERTTLAVIDSPPLDDIIATSLIDATTAEMLFKEYGIRSGTSAERVAVILKLALDNGFTFAGLPFNAVGTRYEDGSGRSTLNRTTCEMIHATIVDPDGVGATVIPTAAESPVARCAGATDDMRVLAVASGSTTGVTGWFDAPNGERLTFTMLADDPSRLVVAEDAPEGTEPIGPYEMCNPLQAALLDAITGHPYGPELSELGPVSPGG